MVSFLAVLPFLIPLRPVPASLASLASPFPAPILLLAGTQVNHPGRHKTVRAGAHHRLVLSSTGDSNVLHVVPPRHAIQATHVLKRRFPRPTFDRRVGHCQERATVAVEANAGRVKGLFGARIHQFHAVHVPHLDALVLARRTHEKIVRVVLQASHTFVLKFLQQFARVQIPDFDAAVLRTRDDLRTVRAESDARDTARVAFEGGTAILTPQIPQPHRCVGRTGHDVATVGVVVEGSDGGVVPLVGAHDFAVCGEVKDFHGTTKGTTRDHFFTVVKVNASDGRDMARKIEQCRGSSHPPHVDEGILAPRYQDTGRFAAQCQAIDVGGVGYERRYRPAIVEHL